MPRSSTWRQSTNPFPVLILFLVSFVAPTAYGDEATCGPLENAFGPFDYRDPEARGESLRVVEAFHFTSEVENLVRGRSGTIAQDLDYTLRAFPNHHRALYSAVRFQLSGLRGLVRSLDCYFDRAIRFRPDDATIHLIQGIYFNKSNRLSDSIRSYRRAVELQPDLADGHYNLGLALLADGELADANAHAQQAYRLGHPLPGLRNRLEKQGAWKPMTGPRQPKHEDSPSR